MAIRPDGNTPLQYALQPYAPMVGHGHIPTTEWNAGGGDRGFYGWERSWLYTYHEMDRQGRMAIRPYGRTTPMPPPSSGRISRVTCSISDSTNHSLCSITYSSSRKCY